MKQYAIILLASFAVPAALLGLINKPASDSPNEPPRLSNNADCNTTRSLGAGNRCLSLRIPFGRHPHIWEVSKGYLSLEYDRASPVIYKPEGLEYCFFVNSSIVSAFEAYRNDVTIKQANGTEITYRFDAGESVAYPVELALGIVNRLERVDASGNPVTTYNATVYYDHWYSNGSRVRLSAETKKSVAVYTASGLKMTTNNCAITVLKGSAGGVRQVWSAADGLADIVVTSSNMAYEIRLYEPADVNAPDANGLRGVTGDPHTVWKIYNPDGTNEYKRIIAIEEKEAFSLTNSWRYIQSKDDWVFEQAGGERRTLHLTESNASATQKLKKEFIYAPDGKTLESSIYNYWIKKYWGMAKEKTVIDPKNLNLAINYTYYENPSDIGRYGKIKYVTYPDGNWQAFDYDTQGRKTYQVTPWLGQPASPLGQTAEQLAFTGHCVKYSYEPHNASDTLRVVDSRPRTTETYIGGKLIARSYASYVTETDGSQTTTKERCTDLSAAYDDASSLRTVIKFYPPDAANASAARMKSIRRPDGVVYNFFYKAGDWTGSFANPSQAAFTENDLGSALRVIVEEGTDDSPTGIIGKTTKTVTYEDDYGNKVLTETWARTDTYTRIAWSARAYDAFHNPTDRIDSAGYESAMGFTGTDMPVAAIDDYGLGYTYQYDALGRLSTEIRQSAGSSPAVTNSIVYNSLDQIIEARVSSGNYSRTLLERSYDRAGRVISETDEQGRTESYGYSATGLVIDNTLPGGGVRTLTTWPGGKIRSVTGNAVTPLYFTYGVNAQSNLWVCGTSGSENSGADTVSYYDPAGRTKYIEYADELFDTYDYDILGRMTNLLDRAGRTVRYGWDALSNPLSVENEIGDDFAKVSFGFDKPSLTESITNQLNQQIMFSTRDIPGRKVTERDIEDQDEVTRFLAGDRVSSVTRCDGVLVSNVWNAAGNLVEVRYDDDPQLHISWRADELPLQMSNTVGEVSWNYDEYGRPFIETQKTLSGTFSATVSSALNSAALPSRVTVRDASGSEITACAYGYDSAERISTVTPQLPTPSSSPSPVSYVYDAVHGLPSEVSGDVLDAEYNYNLLGQVTNITHRKASGGVVVSSFGYLYNAAGMITNKQSKVDGVQSTTSYTYDELNRLTSETLTPITPSGSPSSTLYTYDLAGNRLTAGNSTFTYSNNKLSSVLHDAAGNITNMTQNGVTLDLSWNVQGQLTSVNTNGFFAESYQYDPLGRRVSTTTLIPNPSSSPTPNTVYHVYDGDQCVADVDGSGNLLLSYTWGVGIDNLLSVSVHDAGETNSYYAVKDHLLSVHALVDESGNVVNTFSYDAWGTPLNSSFSIHNSSLHLRYLFQGREYSIATGLYNFRARWYSSDVGRWLSPDPIGLEGGLNLYEFCGNNPVNYCDPYGLVIVTLYDGFESDNGRARTIVAQNIIPGGYSYNMGHDESLNGAINYMIQVVQSGVEIDRVIIIDHGYVSGSSNEDSSLGQEYGSSELLQLPCGKPQDYLTLGSLITENGYIDLWGCHVGDNMANVQEYANAFGREVVATSAATTYIETGNAVIGVYQPLFSRHSRFPQ